MAVVSFAKDIVPLFDTKTDVPHMAALGVRLADLRYMSDPDNAKDILDHLTGAARPIMPPPRPVPGRLPRSICSRRG